MLEGWAQLGGLLVDGPGRAAGPRSVGEAVVEALRPPQRRAWRATARPEQQLVADADAFIRLAMCGRGWGKGFSITNALAEWATDTVGDYAAISPTLGDARKILTEGPSGLLKALGDDVAEYNRSTLVIHLVNGSRIVLASAERPDRLRGWNLAGAIIDELASFPRSTVRELWDAALMPALRIGDKPKLAIATTPRRDSPILRELVARADQGDPAVLIIHGSTFDNRANLSSAFLEEVERRYGGGSTIGRQEIEGELLSDVEGALVSSTLIEQTRVRVEQVPDLWRVVVGVDPAVTSTEHADETGIVVVGVGGPPIGGYTGRQAAVHGPHLFLLADASIRARPEVWARRTLDVAAEWVAEGITAEQNQGADLIQSMIRLVGEAERLPIPALIPVWATRSKYLRAEPTAGAWQQGRVHVVGALPELEDSWSSWVPGDPDSPDRLDACVHACVALVPELGAKQMTSVRLIA